MWCGSRALGFAVKVFGGRGRVQGAEVGEGYAGCGGFVDGERKWRRVRDFERIGMLRERRSVLLGLWVFPLLSIRKDGVTKRGGRICWQERWYDGKVP